MMRNSISGKLLEVGKRRRSQIAGNRCRWMMAALFTASLGAGARASDLSPAGAGEKRGARACEEKEGGAEFRRAVLEAIRSEMSQRGGSEARDLQESDLLIQTCPPEGDSGLPVAVERVEYDALRRRAGFLMRWGGPGHALPFLVMAVWERWRDVLVATREISTGESLGPQNTVFQKRVSSDWEALTTAPSQLERYQARRRIGTGEGISAGMVKQPLLVSAWKPALLRIEGRRFLAETTVMPLESGVLGQQVRASDGETGQTRIGTVIGPNSLSAVY